MSLKIKGQFEKEINMSKKIKMISPETISNLVQRLERIFTTPPRCHLFSTGRKTYAYDVNTGEIIACDLISILIIQGLGKSIFSERIHSLTQNYGLNIVADRLQQLLSLSTEHVPPLFSTKPPEIRYYLEYETFESIVNHKLERMCLALTFMCNMSCKYCIYSGAYFHRPKHSGRFMSKEILELSLKYFVEHSTESKIPSVTFYGGEPLLALSLLHHAVDYLNKKLDRKSYELAIATNFLHVTKEIMTFLRDHNFRVYVSLDGPKSVNDRYRVTTDGKGTFEQITTNLRLLKKFDEDFYNKKVIIKPTLAPPYRYSEIRDFLENNNFFPKGTSFILNSVAQPGTIFKNCSSEFFCVEEFNQQKEKYLELARQGELGKDGKYYFLRSMFDQTFTHIYRRKRLDKVVKAFSPSGICIPGRDKLFVDPKGDFYICERLPQHQSMLIGNCYSGMDIQKAYQLCQDHTNITAKECSKCWAMLLCNDICFGHSVEDDGPNKIKKLNNCEQLRSLKSMLLRDLCSVLEENPSAFEYMNEFEVS